MFQPAGSGSTAASSGGSKNYLTAYTASTSSSVANAGNGDFELGATTGWAKGNVSLTSNLPTGVPTFGSGSSANLSISAVSSSQLAGLYSLSYASSAATVAGDFVASNAFFIDTEDQAKVLTIKFYYQAQTNPSNANWSGTSSNSFGIAIYDVTNSAWIIPAGVWGMTQSSGIGYATATFQTSSSGTQYRLVVYNANATSGSATVYFDDFSVGPQTAPIGIPASDSQSYTPNYVGFGSVTTTLMEWRRIGEKMEIYGTFVFGTNTATAATMSLPSGYSADINKYSVSGTTYTKVGDWEMGSTGGVKRGTILAASGGTTLSFSYDDTGGSVNPLVPQNGSVISGSAGLRMSVHIVVAINGWSSNVQMSNDTDTRVVSLSANNNAGSTTANTAISGWTITKDTHGSFVTGGTYTIPVSGDYVATFSAATTTGTPIAQIYKNGSLFAKGVGSGVRTSVTVILPGLVAGDLITPRLDSSLTLTSTTTDTIFSLNRLSGPSVVAATESVNARYFASATSISGSLATISWTTKDFDSHGAMSSGTYTIPVTGKYSISSAVATTGTFALNNTVVIEIQKNGSVVTRSKEFAGGVVTDLSANASDTLSCVAGDTIRVQLSSAATSPTIVSSNFENWFSIARVGN